MDIIAIEDEILLFEFFYFSYKFYDRKNISNGEIDKWPKEFRANIVQVSRFPR